MKLTAGSLRFHIPRLAKHGGCTHKDYLDAHQVCTLKNHKHLEVLNPSPHTNQTRRKVSGFLTGTWRLERDEAPVEGINHSQSGPLLQKNKKSRHLPTTILLNGALIYLYLKFVLKIKLGCASWTQFKLITMCPLHYAEGVVIKIDGFSRAALATHKKYLQKCEAGV